MKPSPRSLDEADLSSGARKQPMTTQQQVLFNRAALIRLCVLVLIAGCLATGCARTTLGRKFNPAAARKIQKGRTTKAEVVRLMGEPLTVLPQEGGGEELRYWYVQSAPTAAHSALCVGALVATPVGLMADMATDAAHVKKTKTVQRSLFVLVGPDGVVREISASESEF